MNIDLATTIIGGVFVITAALLSNLIQKITPKKRKVILEQMLEEVYEPLYLSLRADMFCTSPELFELFKDILKRKSKLLISPHEDRIRLILAITDESIRKTDQYIAFANGFYLDILITYNQLRRNLGYPYSDIVFGYAFHLYEYKGNIKSVVFPKIITLLSTILVMSVIIYFSPDEVKTAFLYLSAIVIALMASGMLIVSIIQLTRLSRKQTHVQKQLGCLEKIVYMKKDES